MSNREADRAAQIAALLDETGRTSALSVLLSQAVADYAGLHPTDVEALDHLRRFGPLSAGRLAEFTGLTTGGAVTKLIDRLERAGYVQRESDSADRRRVLVRARIESAEAELGPLYAGLEAAICDLTAGYSDAELTAILDFATRANQLTADQVEFVRRLTAERAMATDAEPT